MSLKLGAQVLTYGSTWPEALETAQLMDRLGYDYLWGHDHLYSTGGDPYQRFFEGWTTLAAGPPRRAGQARPAGRGQHVPQPGRRRQDGRDHRPHQRRPLDPGPGRRQRRVRERGPRDRSRPDDGRADGLVRGGASRSSSTCWPAGRSRTSSDKYQFEKVRHAPGRSRRACRSSSAPRARSAACASPPGTLTSGSGSPARTRLTCSATRTTVLRQHCETEGRDAARDRADARLQVHHPLLTRGGAARGRGSSWPSTSGRRPSREVVWAGTPQQVADWLTPFVEAGVGSFSPQIGWPYDRETIERLIGEVKPIVDARTG